MVVIGIAAVWSDVLLGQNLIELRFGGSITGTDSEALNNQISSQGLEIN